MATVIVGLGNPGPEYRATRHNVGQHVVERLADRIDQGWQRDAQALVARGQWQGEAVLLVKPLAFMNLSGPVVATALRHHDAGPADLILVHDDLDLPLGTVRTRLKGGHGGHNGVRSVIETLGTEDIRRVKVGIGRPLSKDEIVDHVLAPFAPDELPAVEQAVQAAADRVLALLRPSPSPGGTA